MSAPASLSGASDVLFPGLALHRRRFLPVAGSTSPAAGFGETGLAGLGETGRVEVDVGCALAL